MMPSGATPRDIFTSPQAHGLEQCSIPVPQIAIDNLRNGMDVSQADVYCFVNDKFSIFATGIWNLIGSLKLTVSTSWCIFEQMKGFPQLEDILTEINMAAWFKLECRY